MTVGELMHRGERLPLVGLTTPMHEVIITMTEKSFGLAGVVDREGRLVGVITDGDLRRNIERLGGATAQQVMTREPRVIAVSTVAEDAIKSLGGRVTSLFVVADADAVRAGPRVPLGLVHVHDFLRIGLG
jgi:arabinose-5-phosphate isomerase